MFYIGLPVKSFEQYCQMMKKNRLEFFCPYANIVPFQDLESGQTGMQTAFSKLIYN